MRPTLDERTEWARRDLLAAAGRLTDAGRSSFTRRDLVAEARRAGSPAPDHTLRATIGLHLSGGDDGRPGRPLTRVAPGRYRLAGAGAAPTVRPAPAAPEAAPAPAPEAAPEPPVPAAQAPPPPEVAPEPPVPAAEVPREPEAAEAGPAEPEPEVPREPEAEAAPDPEPEPDPGPGWWSATEVRDAVVRAMAADGWRVGEVEATTADAPWDLAVVQRGALLLIGIEGFPGGAHDGAAPAGAEAHARFAEAVLAALQARSRVPRARVAAAVPDVAAYRALAASAAAALTAARVELWLVDEAGTVRAAPA